MGSLLFTDFDGLNRDTQQLQQRLAACVAPMKKACGADTNLFSEAMIEMSHGQFAKRGSKLRMVAEEAGVLAQVADLLPQLKQIDFTHGFSNGRGFGVEQLATNYKLTRAMLMESRLKHELAQAHVCMEKDGKMVPLSFEQALHDEQKRRNFFLEACNDMMKHDVPGKPFDAKQLFTGAALAHHRILSNQPVILPYFCEPDSGLTTKHDPFQIGPLNTKLSGYYMAFGFARKDLVSETKAHAKDGQKRDYWMPAICLDTRLYESLMKVQSKAPKGRTLVNDTLGAIQKFFMMSSHDYIHHSMYTILPMEREARIGGWNSFEGPDSTYRAIGSPPKLTDHLEEYRAVTSHFFTENEYTSLAMHRRILRHLFNSETIDGQDNVRGRNIKAALVKSGEKFATDLGRLREELQKHGGVTQEEAKKMTQCLAMVGLSQLGLAIDLDDPGMQKIMAAVDKQQIFPPYKLPAEKLNHTSKLGGYFAGTYRRPPDGGITRGYLESAEPQLRYRYLVKELKKWTADLAPDEPISNVTLDGVEGIKARLMTKPWGDVVSCLNDHEVGREFCPRIAQTYYDAFMEPAILESKPFKTAAEGYRRATGEPADFSRF